eukprot:8456248-Heterocapsa_arctica.AAC.1
MRCGPSGTLCSGICLVTELQIMSRGSAQVLGHGARRHERGEMEFKRPETENPLQLCGLVEFLQTILLKLPLLDRVLT